MLPGIWYRDASSLMCTDEAFSLKSSVRPVEEEQTSAAGCSDSRTPTQERPCVAPGEVRYWTNRFKA